jgi:hypothetical protein
MAFSPDGKRLVTTNWGPDNEGSGRFLGVVTVWEAETGKELFSLKKPWRDLLPRHETCSNRSWDKETA